MKLRGKSVNKSWAPWWKAQSEACRISALALGAWPADVVEKKYAHDVAFVERLNSMANN